VRKKANGLSPKQRADDFRKARAMIAATGQKLEVVVREHSEAEFEQADGAGIHESMRNKAAIRGSFFR
jgi:hypothetical protein